MNWNIRTRHLLSVFALITTVGLSGCATVKIPDFEPQFQKYEVRDPSKFEKRQKLEAPEVTFEDGRAYVSEQQFIKWEVFVERAHGQQIVLAERENEIVAMEREIQALVMAGIATEQQLALISEMYENEARECQWVRFSAYGVAGLSFIFLGIGAL